MGNSLIYPNGSLCQILLKPDSYCELNGSFDGHCRGGAPSPRASSLTTNSQTISIMLDPPLWQPAYNSRCGGATGRSGRQQVIIPIVVYTESCELSEDSEPLALEAVEGLGWRKRI